jgi:hypothetical protein
MWRGTLPQRNSDGWLAAGLMVGLPAIFLLTQGAPIAATLITASLIGGVLLIVHS